MYVHPPSVKLVSVTARIPLVNHSRLAKQIARPHWSMQFQTVEDQHMYKHKYAHTGRNSKQEVCDWDSHPQPPFLLRDNKSNHWAIAVPRPFRTLITPQPIIIFRFRHKENYSTSMQWFKKIKSFTYSAKLVVGNMFLLFLFSPGGLMIYCSGKV